jgi:DNA-binding winged helix-turn-helix (wHTH) protein/TolB-like protein/tetratricopeptide (TPR) repeat protein
MDMQAKRLYEFGEFRLDTRERQLFRNKEPIALTPKAYETLLALVENAGHVVDKNDFMQRIWHDSFVEEGTLAQNVFILRKIFGESSGKQFIETVPRRGYRFIPDVKVLDLEEPAKFTDAKSAEAKSSNSQPKENTVAPVESPLRSGLMLTKARLGPMYLAILGSLTLAGLGFSGYYLWDQKNQSITNKTLAVLPFAWLNPNGRDDYLGLGMADALITKLSNIDYIIVRPTSSVLKYNSMLEYPPSVGKTLDVDLILEGKIQTVNDRLRVTVQLIESKDGKPVWGGEFNERFDDIFAVQDSISRHIAEAVTVRLTSRERKLLDKHYTENTTAYMKYLKGRYHWDKWTDEGFKKSIEFFQQAIEDDPQYALAYAGLADAYDALAFNGFVPPDDVMPKAKAAGLKAISIDSSLGEAHTSLASAILFYDWDFQSAEREFQLAIESNPRSAMAHLGYGICLMVKREFDAAVSEIEKAREVDPLSLLINTTLGFPYFYSGRYDEAIDQYKRVLELDQNFALAQGALGDAYAEKGMYDEALDAYKKRLSLSKQNPTVLASIGYVNALAGQKSEALKIAKDLEGFSKQYYVSPDNIAKLYVGLGDHDRALQWLEKAIADRSNRVVFFKIQPSLSRLRADARFEEMTKRLNLP